VETGTQIQTALTESDTNVAYTARLQKNSLNYLYSLHLIEINFNRKSACYRIAKLRMKNNVLAE